ncbi:MAG: histidine phosphatase family protein, partial [Actinobacteria bacterium]|nr:histidine phosphatase family protein [Actinomycetota bacterium]
MRASRATSSPRSATALRPTPVSTRPCACRPCWTPCTAPTTSGAGSSPRPCSGGQGTYPRGQRLVAQTVTLVRHGETERSKFGVYSGRLDVPLTDVGREQALRAAQRLADADVDAVVTSPLVRAHDTAA